MNAEREKVNHEAEVLNSIFASLAARVRVSIELLNAGQKEEALVLLGRLESILPAPNDQELLRVRHAAYGLREVNNQGARNDER